MNEIGVGLTMTASSGEKKLVSRLPDAEGMRRHVRAALRRAELTERELMIVQRITSSSHCHACHERGRVGVILRTS